MLNLSELRNRTASAQLDLGRLSQIMRFSHGIHVHCQVWNDERLIIWQVGPDKTHRPKTAKFYGDRRRTGKVARFPPSQTCFKKDKKNRSRFLIFCFFTIANRAFWSGATLDFGTFLGLFKMRGRSEVRLWLAAEARWHVTRWAGHVAYCLSSKCLPASAQ